MLNKSIAQQLSITEKQVNTVIQLLDEGATIPFIARYRKEATSNLDEVKIGEIKSNHEVAVELNKRRSSIIKTIGDQGQLTPELSSLLKTASTLQELEDIYLPYKQKRKTKALAAAELGLTPLAKTIYSQNEKNIKTLAKNYLTPEVKTIENALGGARDIIAEWINENSNARNTVRRAFDRGAQLTSKVKKAKITEAVKFKDYFDFSEVIKSIPSHRYLAIKRAQEAGFLNVKIKVDNSQTISLLERLIIKPNSSYQSVEQIKEALKDAYNRLLLPSIEKEYDSLSKLKADKEAISIFSTNLRQLLLGAPLGQKRIMAIDPGLRTGCKTIILNELGDLLYETVIYPLKNEQLSEKTIKELLLKYNTEAIAVGNGTGGRETETFIKKIIANNSCLDKIVVHMVSEQGASIYSASEIAREEFPEQDITVRGAVSIGRRLKDPLAELVKIDPKSIGVGQYQHDVNPKLLKENLDQVVISCVNQVGVQLNTASKHLLSYVSGLGPVLAQNIVDFRSENGKFTSRTQLKKVPRLGAKAFEQAAGFLRIVGAKNPLDNSAVHPESYTVVNRIAKDLKVSVAELMDQNESITRKRTLINIENYVSESMGLLSLTDILNELSKPGRDPREQLEVFEFGNVNSIQELSSGMVLPGIVTNITAFGCFVDIGVHQDGLVHVSQLANKFVKDPNEIVSLNQKVQVKVVEVDVARKRIALSMKEV